MFQEFLQTGKAIRTQMYVGMPLELKADMDYKLQPSVLTLPPLFSHMNLLVIQALAETGYGEFRVKVEKRNHEFVVHLNCYPVQRYFVSKKESGEMEKEYWQIIKALNRWWMSSNSDRT